MLTLGISAEARGRVRRFKQELTRSAERLGRAEKHEDVRRALSALLMKRSPVGLQRALKAVSRFLPSLRVECVSKDFVLWSFLYPREAVIADPTDPGQTQDAVTVNYHMIQPDIGHIKVNSGLWTLEIPDHALGRLAERSSNVDFGQAIFRAHDAMLASKVVVPFPRRARTLYLPAGNGVFVGQLIKGRSENADSLMVYFRARTWLHEDQLHDEQVALERGTPAFGDALMLPFPLRKIESVGREIEVTPRLAS